MSTPSTCPRCHQNWSPTSRQEAASAVCMTCRAQPSLGSFVEATPGSASRVAPGHRHRAHWPLAAACLLGLLLIVGAGLFGAAVALSESPPAAIEPEVAEVPPSPAMPTALIAEPIGPPRLFEGAKSEPPVEAKPPQPIVKSVEPKAPVVAMPETRPTVAPELPAPKPFRRRKQAPFADELIRDLHKVREIQLEKSFNGPVTRDLVLHANAHRTVVPRPHPEALSRGDLVGLPMRMGMDCYLSKESAEALQILSRKLRAHMSDAANPPQGSSPRSAPAVPDGRIDVKVLRQRLECDGDEAWAVPEAVPTFVQLLQAEDRPVRMLMVEMLSRIKGREAGAAIARRAVFDVSAEVREQAVTALRERPVEDYRDVLLEGLRHVWAPASEFAAEAIVNLGNASMASHLIKLLDQPDPAAPIVSKPNEPRLVREMVRVNHLRNCMLCHAPSLAETDLVRAAAPNPSQPLPPAFTPAYYSTPANGSVVRADITYLKQDFAVPQVVANQGHWPSHQRYDYLVRLRPLAPFEKPVKVKPGAIYPQKDATLFALRELTGVDMGDTTADWQPYLAKLTR